MLRGMNWIMFTGVRITSGEKVNSTRGSSWGDSLPSCEFPKVGTILVTVWEDFQLGEELNAHHERLGT